jgi:1-acyl-sn-glycerol-3-phosphate acyltransferase
LGVVDAGARTARKVLGEGYSMQLFPGGIQEQLATNSHKPVIVARQRTGFVKLALSYNTPIVPVYVFGEDKLYTSVSFLLRARKWLVRALRVGWPLFYGRLDRLGLLPHARPLVAVVGEPLWPAGVSRATQERDWAAQAKAKAEARQARKEAKGKKEHSAEATHSPSALQADDSAPPPLFAKTTGRRLPREVSPEEVNAMLDRYVAALEELFDKHKASQPGYEDAKLTVLSARG